MAQRNKVEIMLVLDRSGSMAGTPLSNLKTAARAFLEYYQDTEDEDKIGLVTFATSVSLRAPATNFFTPITNSINAMSATGATNAEDALAQAGCSLPGPETGAKGQSYTAVHNLLHRRPPDGVQEHVYTQ